MRNRQLLAHKWFDFGGRRTVKYFFLPSDTLTTWYWVFVSSSKQKIVKTKPSEMFQRSSRIFLLRGWSFLWNIFFLLFSQMLHADPNDTNVQHHTFSHARYEFLSIEENFLSLLDFHWLTASSSITNGYSLLKKYQLPHYDIIHPIWQGIKW